MAGAIYFSKIDLARVPIAEEDKEKTAFHTQSGLWEFNRMPFGLRGHRPPFAG